MEILRRLVGKGISDPAVPLPVPGTGVPRSSQPVRPGNEPTFDPLPFLS